MSTETPAVAPRFCSHCGPALNPGARFCHGCGAPIDGRPRTEATPMDLAKALRWGVPTLALVALLVLSAIQWSSPTSATVTPGGAVPPGAGATRAPDISSMSPEERADRLFNRVMRLSSEGRADSVAFFGPMALAAIEALAPLDAHRRYDMGLVALVTGDAPRARAQADTILAQRPTHLLGLVLAARA